MRESAVMQSAASRSVLRDRRGKRMHGALLGRCALASDHRDYVAPSSNSSTTRDIRRGILARSVG